MRNIGLNTNNGTANLDSDIFPSIITLSSPHAIRHSKQARKFFETLGGQLGITNLSDWYNMSLGYVESRGGKSVLSNYSRSLPLALQAAFPQHNWIPWMFGKVDKGYWHKQQHKKMYFDWLGKQLGMADLLFNSILLIFLGYKDLADYYKLTKEAIILHGGDGLLISRYKGSITTAMMDTYPDFSWKPWLFEHTPKGYWEDMENQKQYLEWLGKRLGYNSMDDWYKLTVVCIDQLSISPSFQLPSFACDCIRKTYFKMEVAD